MGFEGYGYVLVGKQKPMQSAPAFRIKGKELQMTVAAVKMLLSRGTHYKIAIRDGGFGVAVVPESLDAYKLPKAGQQIHCNIPQLKSVPSGIYNVRWHKCLNLLEAVEEKDV